MSGRRWTQAEIDLLEDRWGSGTMDGLAKKIGRTKVAVRIMGYKLGLGAWSEASEYLSAQTLASAMGISERIVHDWIRIDGMPCVKRKKAKYVYYDIRLDQFWRWMEDKQHLFDSRRIEPLILGEEPPWMAAKRRQDRINRREEAVSLDALVKHSGRHWQTVKKAIMTSGVSYFHFGRHKALYVSSDAAKQVLRRLG